MTLTKNDDIFPRIKIQGTNNHIFIDDKLRPFDKISISIQGNNNTITIKPITITQRGNLFISILGNNNIVEIEEAVIINHNMSLSFFTGGIGARADYCSMRIGSRSFINGVMGLMCSEENTHISIGEDCLFANNIKLTTTDNHSIYDIDTLKRVNNAGNVRIGNHCWICDDVTFLNNSGVADNCVVATKSLVTKDLDIENCCYGGIPAKVIRTNINWDNQIKSDFTSLKDSRGGGGKFAA